MLKCFSSRAFTNIDDIILMGEEEALNHIAHIKQIMDQWKELHEK